MLLLSDPEVVQAPLPEASAGQSAAKTPLCLCQSSRCHYRALSTIPRLGRLGQYMLKQRGQRQVCQAPSFLAEGQALELAWHALVGDFHRAVRCGVARGDGLLAFIDFIRVTNVAMATTMALTDPTLSLSLDLLHYYSKFPIIYYSCVRRDSMAEHLSQLFLTSSRIYTPHPGFQWLKWNFSSRDARTLKKTSWWWRLLGVD